MNNYYFAVTMDHYGFLQLPIRPNSIFSLSVVYGIMGWGLFVCMYSWRCILGLWRCILGLWRCILGLAPANLRDLYHPTPGTRGCSSLRSSEQGLLFVPFARTSTTQARAFSVVGPSVWNGLP